MADVTGPVVVSDDDAHYTLAAGDTLSGGGAALTTKGMGDTVDVAGAIDGGSGTGLLVSAGAKTMNPMPYPNDGSFFGYQPFLYANGSAAITVDKGGSIAGATGILVATPLDDLDVAAGTGGVTSATIDNAGTITGTGGLAIAAAGPSGHVGSLINEAGGVIDGGITGLVTTLTNAGTIDGGARAALDVSMSDALTNSGAITSAAEFATVIGPRLDIVNDGSIANTGSGAAINSDEGTINNQANGVITAGSNGVAINEAEDLNLFNSGTINGDVVVNERYFSSRIDQSGGGIINGNVTFDGYGFDVFVARGLKADGSIDTGVTGVLDGGDAFDIIRVSVSSDAMLTGDLAKNFEELAVALSHDTSVTVVGTTTSGVQISGKGSLVNNGSMSAASNPVVSAAGDSNGGTLEVHNTGSITARAPNAITNQSTAVSLGDLQSQITAHVQAFTNSGSVIATAANAVTINSALGRYFTFQNDGVIKSGSSGGAAAIVFFNGTKTDVFLNSAKGTIENDHGQALRLTGLDGAAHQSAENDGRIIGLGLAAEVIRVDLTNAGDIHTVAGSAAIAFTAAVQMTHADLHNSGRITSDGASVLLQAESDVFGPDHRSDLTNSGLIQSYSNTAVLIGDGGTTLDNQSSGQIKGRTAIGWGDQASHQPVVITNEGHIFGDINLGRSDYSGVSDYQIGMTVVNHGYVRGTVKLDASNDHYDGEGGSLSGKVLGGDGSDTLIGGGGHDRLEGDNGSDIITGGGGSDVLSGGAASDTFLFTGHDGGLKADSADEITDFSSAEGDRIDVSAIDPTATTSAFSFIGTAAFDGGAGELRYYTHGGQTFVEADYDGDGHRDLLIKLDGVHALTAADFVL